LEIDPEAKDLAGSYLTELTLLFVVRNQTKTIENSYIRAALKEAITTLQISKRNRG